MRSSVFDQVGTNGVFRVELAAEDVQTCAAQRSPLERVKEGRFVDNLAPGGVWIEDQPVFMRANSCSPNIAGFAD